MGVQFKNILFLVAPVVVVSTEVKQSSAVQFANIELNEPPEVVTIAPTLTRLVHPLNVFSKAGQLAALTPG